MEMESSRLWPWTQGTSRTTLHVLGLGLGLERYVLGLGGQVLGLDLARQFLGLGLGLEGSGLDSMSDCAYAKQSCVEG